MRSIALTLALGTALFAAAPAVTQTAAAQPVPGAGSSPYLVPVIVGAAAGATAGALLWPVLMPPAVVVSAPGAAMMAPEVVGWGLGAFVTTRAAIGAVIGAGIGYVMAR